MEKYKPKYYIEIRFEPIPVYGYHGYDADKIVGYSTGIFRYCNGVKIRDMPKDSFERKNQGELYWESYWFNKCLKISRYDESIWTSKNAMDAAFEKIFTKKLNGDGDYVPMKDFEIWLMCKGYKMISFDKMCSQTPCFAIVCDKQEGNKITNPKGLGYTRFYHNEETEKTIFFGYGIKSENLKFLFYFVHSDNMHLNYQTPIKTQDFEKAENCQLKSFQELDYEIRKEKTAAVAQYP